MNMGLTQEQLIEINELITFFHLYKNKSDNPTFGILLCKDKKRVTAELALKDINKPIGVSEYKILSEIPEFLENTLPSNEDIEKRLDAGQMEALEELKNQIRLYDNLKARAEYTTAPWIICLKRGAYT